MPPTRCHDCPLRLSNGILHRPARPVSACRLGLRHAAAHAPGLRLTCIDAHAARPWESEVEGPPAASLCVLLDGCMDTALRGARALRIGSGMCAFMQSSERSAGFNHMHAGRRFRLVGIHLAPAPCWPQAAPWPRRPAPRALPASAISAKPSASTPAAPRRRGRWPASGRLWIGWRSNRRIGRPGGCAPEAAGGLRARAGFLPLPRADYPQVFPDLIARFAVFTGAAGRLPV